MVYDVESGGKIEGYENCSTPMIYRLEHIVDDLRERHLR